MFSDQIYSQGKKGFYTCTYPFLCQSHARSSRLWLNDIINATGQEINFLTLSAGYKQMIDKSTHVVNNPMSRIYLLYFTNQNMNSNYWVDVSIFDKYHHNIIFRKINISVPLRPVYVCEVWDYSHENVDNIKKAISNFNLSKAHKNLSVDEGIEHLNESLLNIFRNYVPNKKIKYQPPRIFDNIKSNLKQRSKLRKVVTKTV